jgi:DNA-directed RNA polymerase subunit RPC12/RpoP
MYEISKAEQDSLLYRDRCSICGREFPNRSTTIFGRTADGYAAIACERCADRIKAMCGFGVYFRKPLGVPSTQTEH